MAHELDTALCDIPSNPQFKSWSMEVRFKCKVKSVIRILLNIVGPMTNNHKNNQSRNINYKLAF